MSTRAEEFQAPSSGTQNRNQKATPDSDCNNEVPTKARKKQTRSFNGCWTCRSRKIRCDMTRPVCANCLNLNLQCNFEVKLTWYQLMTLNNDRSEVLTLTIPLLTDASLRSVGARAKQALSNSYSPRQEAGTKASYGVPHYKRSHVEFAKWDDKYKYYEDLDEALHSLRLGISDRHGQIVRGPFSVFRVQKQLVKSESSSYSSQMGGSHTFPHPRVAALFPEEPSGPSEESNAKILNVYNRHTDFFGLNHQQRLEEERQKKLLAGMLVESEEDALMELGQNSDKLMYTIHIQKWLESSLIRFFLITYNFHHNQSLSSEQVMQQIKTNGEFLIKEFLHRAENPLSINNSSSLKQFVFSLQSSGFWTLAVLCNSIEVINSKMVNDLVKNFKKGVLPKLSNYHLPGFNVWESLIWKTELLPILHEFMFDDEQYLEIINAWLVKEGSTGEDNSSGTQDSEENILQPKILVKLALMFLIFAMSSFNLYCIKGQAKYLSSATNLSSIADCMISSVLKPVIGTYNDSDLEAFAKRFANINDINDTSELIKLALLFVTTRVQFNSMIETDLDEWFKLGNQIIRILETLNCHYHTVQKHKLMVLKHSTSSSRPLEKYTSFNENLFDDFFDQDLNTITYNNIGEGFFYLIKVFKVFEVFHEATHVYNLSNFQVMRIKKFKQVFDSMDDFVNIEETRECSNKRLSSEAFLNENARNERKKRIILTNTEMESSLLQTTIKVMPNKDIGQEEEKDATISDRNTVAGGHPHDANLGLLHNVDFASINIPLALQKNFIDKFTNIYRNNDTNNHYDINDDYEFNDDEDPPPPTVEITFKYGESTSGESSADEEDAFSNGKKSPSSSISNTSEYRKENGRLSGPTAAAFESRKDSQNEKAGSSRENGGIKRRAFNISLLAGNVNHKDINTMLELSFGMPLSLVKVFQQIVQLTKHQFYFLVEKINLRELPTICADIEDSLLNWRLPWDLYEEVNNEVAHNEQTIETKNSAGQAKAAGHNRKKKFYSIDHEILYHNIMSFYHALIVYYFTLVKDIPSSLLHLHFVKIYEHLHYLKFVLKAPSSGGEEGSRDSRTFNTFRPSFFALFMAGVETKNPRLQQSLKELMEYYEEGWQHYHLHGYWCSKQLMYEIWRMNRDVNTREQAENEISWIDVAKGLDWDFSVL